GDQGPTGEPGLPGKDGKNVKINVTDTEIQWKYDGEDDTSYQTLITLDKLTGKSGTDGKAIELRSYGDYIQWKYKDDPNSDWDNLVLLDTIKGPAGTNGKDGADGREIELTVRPPMPAQDVYDDEGNFVTTIPARDERICWRYTSGDDQEWRKLIDKSELKGTNGKDADITGGIDLRLVQDVVLSVDPSTGATVTEDQIQWKNEADPDDDVYWKRLCAAPELNITASPEPKDSWMLTGDGTVDTLSVNSTYVVTMSITATNTSLDRAFSASITDGTETVKGTWYMATPQDSDPTAIDIPFSASYSTSYTITGVDAISFSCSIPDVLTDVGVRITVVEV
ncbi:MAG: hypothetical protein J5379_07095, partial [Clostridiales bacterium]|nr:hypothetical protein [Clostridiales bacterium]